MATTVHEPPKIDPAPLQPSLGGNGGGGVNLPLARDGELRELMERPPEPVRTGIWVGLAAITMMFAAFTSALIVRQGSAVDWEHLALPRILYLNTAILLLSSLTLESARRKVASFVRGQGATRGQAMQLLASTLGLGLVFVAGQYVAWLQLRSKGLYIATNPNSSFFYVLTAVHAIHVLGGLGGLLLVTRRFARTVPTLRKSTLDAAAYYWHFMGILWVYLMFVLWLKL
jgi:cytochrome c oxidase subunit 3